MRRLWSIVSNAALRSSTTRIVPYVLLRSYKIFVVTLVIAVSVYLFGTFVQVLRKVQSILLVVRKEESCFETTLSKVLEIIERICEEQRRRMRDY